MIQKEILFKNGKTKTLARKETYHTALENCRVASFIQSGRLKLIKILSTGKQVVLNEFSQGEMFGELLIFSGAPYPGWLIADEPSVILEIDSETLLDYLKEEESLFSFMKGISKKVSSYTQTIEILSYKTIKQKVACELLLQEGRGHKKIILNVSHMSERLGCTREALSRALTVMEREGFIHRENSFCEIGDSSRLEDMLYKD